MCPTIQSSYADNVVAAYAGALVNTEPKIIISRTVEHSAGLAFGLAVMQGANDKGCLVGDGSAFLGVTVRDQSVDPAAPSKFAQYSEARILTKGVIWVLNSGGVAAGDPVVALAAGELGTGSSPLVDGARWDTSADDGELAQVRLG